MFCSPQRTWWEFAQTQHITRWWVLPDLCRDSHLSGACWIQIMAMLPEICNSACEISVSVTGNNKQTNKLHAHTQATSPGLVQTSLYCIEMDLIGQQLEIKKWPHIRPWDDTCLAVLTTKWCPCAKAGSSCPQVLDWGVWMGKLVIYGLIFWNYVLLLLKGKNNNWKLSVMGYLSSLNSGAVETLGSLRAWWSGTYQTGSFGCWGSMTQLHAQILSCLAVELSGNWKLSGNLVTW